MLTLIDWKNLPPEGDVSDYERIKIQLERTLRKNRDVLYSIGDNHEEGILTVKYSISLK